MRRIRTATELRAEYVALGGDIKRTYGTSRQMLVILVDRIKSEKKA